MTTEPAERKSHTLIELQVRGKWKSDVWSRELNADGELGEQSVSEVLLARGGRAGLGTQVTRLSSPSSTPQGPLGASNLYFYPQTTSFHEQK